MEANGGGGRRRRRETRRHKCFIVRRSFVFRDVSRHTSMVCQRRRVTKMFFFFLLLNWRYKYCIQKSFLSFGGRQHQFFLFPSPTVRARKTTSWHSVEKRFLRDKNGRTISPPLQNFQIKPKQIGFTPFVLSEFIHNAKFTRKWCCYSVTAILFWICPLKLIVCTGTCFVSRHS